MYRISKDYTNFLLQSSNVSEIVNSIINVPWICLQRSDRYYDPKNKTGPPFNGDNHYPFLNITHRETAMNSNSQNSMDYFLELDIAHPISDKVYYSIAYSSTLTQKEPMARNTQMKELVDTYFIGEARKCFIDRKEIIIPDVTFILHIKMTIPALKRVKQFTCIVYSLHEQPYSQAYLSQGGGEHTVTLELDEESLLTFCFNSYFVNTQTETGLAALNSLYPWESKQFLDSLNLHRLILSHSKCKFQFFETEARNLALSEIYTDIYRDVSGKNFESSSNGTQHNLAADSDHYSSAKQLTSQHGNQATRSKSSGKESDQPELSGPIFDEEPEDYDPRDDSLQKSDSAAVQEIHTFEQILKDATLLKHYANPSQKTTLVQEVLLSMTEDDFGSCLSYLKHSLRDLCKSKYGNYIIQIFAQNLPKKRLHELLNLVGQSY